MSAKILLVDDEYLFTQAIWRSLHTEGYNIRTASSAKEALGMLDEEPADVVVSDQKMPGLCGSEFLAIVQEKHPDTIRIMLTGQASLETAIRAINEGHVFRFLMKPCTGLELSVAIKQGLQHRKLLIQSSHLLKVLQKQSSVLDQLENEHPGITKVTRSQEGAIVID
ncbi:MAG: response regulator, partial [Candidatus Eisenbacteria sp.]|nr:response regulator [Candidatus Eisenbacteria bacterium]